MLLIPFVQIVLKRFWTQKAMKLNMRFGAHFYVQKANKELKTNWTRLCVVNHMLKVCASCIVVSFEVSFAMVRSSKYLTVTFQSTSMKTLMEITFGACTTVHM